MRQCDYINLENEFIPAATINEAAKIAGFNLDNFVPGIDCLATIQDKYLQRQHISSAGIPGPFAVDASQAPELGFPVMLKSRLGGYDGKGTRVVQSESEFKALESKQISGWMAEQFVEFNREVSVMVCATGTEFFSFPAMITEQTNQVCDTVYLLADKDKNGLAQQVAVSTVAALGGRGLFGVELFETKSGEFWVNEVAPRPHNPGHYTQNWGGTSQFDAHLLLTMGAFGGVVTGSPACMVNILGLDNVGSASMALLGTSLAHPTAFLHWYGKRITKSGRKMGHINTVGPECKERAIGARATFLEAWRT
jgi:5-(carboxyamino)imidazole ribonucleotide synthase